MYLKKIVLHGFKSFADRTELELTKGVTVIVGPNGCGKSNITDALRFCLGETSSKALRGTRLDELIFSGSSVRNPVSMAEVIMHFDNQDNALPLEFNEVSIIRRIFRDEQNQHFINKNSCRLRDIQELFMGTGVGQGSLSFLSQNEADMVLSDSLTRRSILEEIAGTNKYKFRKKEALRKLEYTNSNLNRLKDLVFEIENQLKSLEKQLDKYRRYKRAQERLLKLEKEYILWQIRILNEKLVPLKEEEEKFLKEKIFLEEKIKNLKSEKNIKESEYHQKENEFTSFNAIFSEKQINFQNQTNLVELISERKTSSVQKLEEIQTQIAQTQLRISQIHMSVKNLQEEKTLL